MTDQLGYFIASLKPIPRRKCAIKKSKRIIRNSLLAVSIWSFVIKF